MKIVQLSVGLCPSSVKQPVRRQDQADRHLHSSSQITTHLISSVCALIYQEIAAANKCYYPIPIWTLPWLGSCVIYLANFLVKLSEQHQGVIGPVPKLSKIWKLIGAIFLFLCLSDNYFFQTLFSHITLLPPGHRQRWHIVQLVFSLLKIHEICHHIQMLQQTELAIYHKHGTKNLTSFHQSLI